MIRVNLLPHRQLRREARQREFGLMAAVSAIGAAVIVFMGLTYIDAQNNAQVERNTRLETAIVQLDQQIADIKELQAQISIMLERKQAVENLQTNRSQSVVILDEISRQLPDGMYLKTLKQVGNLITLEGVADTNARIATLVRNLSASAWLEAPNLIEIKAEIVNGLKQNAFTMTVRLKPPKTDTEETTSLPSDQGAKS